MTSAFNASNASSYQFNAGDTPAYAPAPTISGSSSSQSFATAAGPAGSSYWGASNNTNDYAASTPYDSGYDASAYASTMNRFSSMLSDPAQLSQMRQDAVNQAAQMLTAQAQALPPAYPSVAPGQVQPQAAVAAAQPQATVAAAQPQAAAAQEQLPPLTGAVHDVADFVTNIGRIFGSRIESLRQLTEPTNGQ